MTAALTPERLAEASAVVPSTRQLAWQRREFAGFLHFGMNTFTDREWGHGHDDPALFAPENFDADQWMRALASAGMTGAILTAKHHDGFCLWPSATTGHTVAASGWRGGRGDVVAEVAAACARRGMDFGVYLSPWDRTEPSYGSGTAYDDVFVAQLTELLTGYGRISTVWFDGACGEGPDGRRQRYDWRRYYAVIRDLQPDAVISVCGPDVRWCGNEAGHTRTDEWSVVPEALRSAELIASRSQQADDAAFARQVRSDDDDLGSRAALAASNDRLVWYPAEVNTSIRPGWFHHPAEDGAVRSAAELYDIYRRSVGGNASLLLNVPPDRTGLIAAPDLAVLAELGRLIAGRAGRDASSAARAYASGHEIPRPRAGQPWQASEGDTLTLRWDAPVLVSEVVFGEDIARGQQLDDVVVSATDASGAEVELARARCVGYCRILDVCATEICALTIRVASARGPVRLSELAALRPA